MSQKVATGFHQPGVSAPIGNPLSKLIGKWTLTWLFLSLVTTAVVGYFLFYPQILEAGFWGWFWRVLVLLIASATVVGIIVVYIHDKTQTDEPVQRMFPVLFWGRKIFTEVGPLFRQYMFANDTEETPYNRLTRNWIYQTSRGKRNTIGFGSQIDMDTVGSTIVLPATFTNLASKTGEETGRSYKKVIGTHTGVETVTMEHFVCISAMSYGALSFRAHAALNLGAKRAGIMHNCGEGGLAPCHEYGGGDLIFQIGTAKYGVCDNDGNLDDDLLRKVAEHPQVKMFEIKLAQGAKPGKGGMLLKEKITQEIADIRNVPMGKDAFAPARHKEFSDVDGLFDFIDHVRDVVKKPVGIKMVIGHTEEIESIAKKLKAEPGRGPDFIVIDGGEGGTGAAPLVLSSYAGLPMKQAVAVADWALKTHGVRDKVVLFASGKIATPVDIAVAMALGAEAVYIARGFLLSLGCIQALECHSNACPTGIATQNKKLEKALDIEAAALRVETYAKSLYKEAQMLAESCGYHTPEDISDDDIMIVSSPGHLDYLSKLHSVSAFEAAQEREEAKKFGTTVGDLKILMEEVKSFKKDLNK
jgi:glutamate synthase domain-containing protein 2